MALTFICHVCATANEKLSEQIALEIKATSSGKKVKKGTRRNIQRMGECILGQLLSDMKGRRREIPRLEPMVRFDPKGPHQVQILSSCPIYKGGSSLSRTSPIGTAGSWRPFFPKGLALQPDLLSQQRASPCLSVTPCNLVVLLGSSHLHTLVQTEHTHTPPNPSL